MITYKHLEDYLERLDGRDPLGYANAGLQIYYAARKIDTDRVDADKISSMNLALFQGRALTERQVSLATVLVRKYSQKLNDAGVAVPDEFQLKNPVRVINKSWSLSREDDELWFCSRYDTTMIAQIKSFVASERGRIWWDNDARLWKAGLTEHTLNWMVPLAQQYNIPIEDDVMALFSLMLETEQTKYAIELNMVAGEVQITNAADSLNEWIDEHGLTGDIVKLADHSSLLGYTIAPEVKKALGQEFGSTFVTLCSERQIRCPDGGGKEKRMRHIIDWAKAVERFPIVVYNPAALLKGDHEFDDYFLPEEILRIQAGSQYEKTLDPGIKLIYTSAPIDIGQTIPLLISKVSLYFGKKAHQLRDRSEKIVWNCVKI